MASKKPIPQHQWTHDGDRVLLVKCVERGGKSHGDFQWPQSGPVKPTHCSRKADCGSGGLFGWPWGINLGGGKEPDYRGDWIVFAAKPEQVVDLNDKAKVCADTPDEVECEVVYYGDWAGAIAFTQDGRRAWVEQNASGSASATGWSGSASATGWRGSASATGVSGSASATGWSGSASATGWRGSASATGEMGSASATGEMGSASATGWRGSASATGEMGSASATGWRGSASATGESGSASATGWRGSAAITAPHSTIKVGPKAAGVVTADAFTWIYRKGAVLLHRWDDGHALLVADGSFPDGTRVEVDRGKIVSPAVAAPKAAAKKKPVHKSAKKAGRKK